MFQESISRILSIAVTHEVLAYNGLDDVDIKTILCKIKKSIVSYGLESSGNITIDILGDTFMVNSEKATSIALVVNELLQNCLEHGFCTRQSGQIQVVIQQGIMYSNISILDDGQGFDIEKVGKDNLGLNIVRSIVKDKLNGNVKIESRFTRDKSSI